MRVHESKVRTEEHRLKMMLEQKVVLARSVFLSKTMSFLVLFRVVKCAVSLYNCISCSAEGTQERDRKCRGPNDRLP